MVIEGLPHEIFKPKPSKGSSRIAGIVAILPFLFIALLISIIFLSSFGQASEEQHPFFEITFLILIALLAQMLASYIEQPRVLVLVILGILISTSFLDLIWEVFPILQTFASNPPNIIQDFELLGVFGQIGIILLLFKIGTHEHLDNVLTRENAIVALLGIAIPFGAGYLYGTSTGGGDLQSIFLGTAFAATSVAITAAILREAGVLGKKFSDIILGAAILDDIISLVLLVLVLSIPSAAGASVIITLIVQVIVMAVFLVGGYLLLRAFMQAFIDSEPFKGQSFLLLLFALFMVSYAAEYIGLSSIVGAFLVGMVFSTSKHVKEINHIFFGLEIAFMPMFFILIGALIDIRLFFVGIVPIFLLAVLAMLTKIIGCGIGALLSRIRPIEAAVVGVGMSPRGEVALVVALFGLNHGILDASMYSLLSGAVLFTMIFSPFILHYLLGKVK